MQKSWTVLMGVLLILLGLFTLVVNAFLPTLIGDMTFLAPWRMWPVVILAVGGILALIALLSVRRKELGVLFIPAAPIATVGAILLYASVFQQWRVWDFAWPFIVMAVAAGFLLAAVFSRNIWLGIPAILIGLNSLVLFFCNVTGFWSWWSVLWTVEPLAIGLILLLISYKTRSTALTIVGLAVCAFAVLAFAMTTGMMLIGGWAFRLTGPALLVLFGVGLFAWGLSGKGRGPVAAAE